jgi:RNA polymerase sigma-70 factor (ECF subfamily)
MVLVDLPYLNEAQDDATMQRRHFELLYQEHYQTVCKFCKKILQDQETAEDITQDAFVTAYQKRMDLRSADRFAAWVKTIAKNLANKYKIQEFKERLAVRMEASFNPRFSGGTNPLRLIERKEWTDAVYDAFDHLNHEYRLVLLLKYYQDMTEAEMSEILRVPLGTVKSRLFRAKRRVRRVLCGELEKDGM